MIIPRKIYIIVFSLFFILPTLAECPYYVPHIDYETLTEKEVIDCFNKSSIKELENNLLSGIYFKTSYKIDDFKWQYAGKLLSKKATRDSILAIINIASLLDAFSEEESFDMFIHKALEENPYETIIALRQIYKKNINFNDKDAEKFFKKIYQSIMDRY